MQALEGGRTLLVSISADDHIRVWSSGTGANANEETLEDWKVQQNITMPLRLQHAVALTPLPNQPSWYVISANISLRCGLDPDMLTRQQSALTLLEKAAPIPYLFGSPVLRVLQIHRLLYIDAAVSSA